MSIVCVFGRGLCGFVAAPLRFEPIPLWSDASSMFEAIGVKVPSWTDWNASQN